MTAPPAIYTSPSPSWADLIFLKDSVSHTNYLVDTGAAISLVPFNSSLAATGPAIVNANGSAIPSWNFVRKQLKFGKQSFVHRILQAKVSQPILGLDFLSRHGISVDCKASKVLFPNQSHCLFLPPLRLPHPPAPHRPTARHTHPQFATTAASVPESARCALPPSQVPRCHLRLAHYLAHSPPSHYPFYPYHLPAHSRPRPSPFSRTISCR